ncbi:LHFPL tetraspan subfamily member 6 protein [Taenia crassiceps]|uniref:LHFPL tetraspan subfamily member 6 protein n=1 Tax=Taenia crassiceps TaxID=6207 RepID=A0ABR4Q6M6_9CEST
MPPQWQVVCLLLIWSLLTILAAGICSASCLLPFWIAGSVDLPVTGGRVISSVSHLGLFRRCGYPTYESNGDVGWTQGCGYYPTMEGVPHWVWRVALVLLIIAACLLVFLAFFVICAGACTSLLRRSLKLSRACSYVYLVAGVCCKDWTSGWYSNLGTQVNQLEELLQQSSFSKYIVRQSSSRSVKRKRAETNVRWNVYGDLDWPNCATFQISPPDVNFHLPLRTLEEKSLFGLSSAPRRRQLRGSPATPLTNRQNC